MCSRTFSEHTQRTHTRFHVRSRRRVSMLPPHRYSVVIGFELCVCLGLHTHMRARMQVRACYNTLAVPRNRIAYKRHICRPFPPSCKSRCATVTYIRDSRRVRMSWKDICEYGRMHQRGAQRTTLSMTNNTGRQEHQTISRCLSQMSTVDAFSLLFLSLFVMHFFPPIRRARVTSSMCDVTREWSEKISLVTLLCIFLSCISRAW